MQEFWSMLNPVSRLGVGCIGVVLLVAIFVAVLDRAHRLNDFTAKALMIVTVVVSILGIYLMVSGAIQTRQEARQIGFRDVKVR